MDRAQWSRENVRLLYKGRKLTTEKGFMLKLALHQWTMEVVCEERESSGH